MKKLIKSALLLIVSILVFIPLTPIGLLITMYKHCSGTSKRGFFMYFFDVLGGALEALGYILESCAIGVDIFFNALAGEGLEKLCCKYENPKTLLGSGKATASAGLGELDRNYGINTKFGRWLKRSLNKFFNEKDHCGYAIELHELKEDFQNSKEPNE